MAHYRHRGDGELAMRCAGCADADPLFIATDGCTADRLNRHAIQLAAMCREGLLIQVTQRVVGP